MKSGAEKHGGKILGFQKEYVLIAAITLLGIFITFYFDERSDQQTAAEIQSSAVERQLREAREYQHLIDLVEREAKDIEDIETHLARLNGKVDRNREDIIRLQDERYDAEQ